MIISPGDVAITFGNMKIYWYGILISVAFLAGLLTTLYLAKSRNYSKEKIDCIFDLASIILVFGIIGARLYYVLFNWHYYSGNIKEIVQLWHGGLSIHGALIGGLIAAFIYTKKNGFSILEFADLYAPGIALGQAIGRWGNFFNSEAFGLPTNLPWKVFIPLQNRPVKFINNDYFHPTFLYESILDFILFFILLNILKNNPAKTNGKVFLFYLLYYSMIRFVIEGIRIDSIYNFMGMPIAQVISLFLIFIALIGLFFVNLKAQARN